MEQYIMENLQNGEEILWRGKPCSVRLLEAPYHKKIAARWAVSLLMLAFCFWYPETSFGMVQSEVFVRNTILLMLAAAIVVALYPMYVVWRLHNTCMYCVTNQRAMICMKTNPVTIQSRMLDHLPEVSWDLLSTGQGTVYIGAKTKASPGIARAQAMSQELAANEQLPLMFYSIKQPEYVVECLQGLERKEERKNNRTA